MLAYFHKDSATSCKEIQKNVIIAKDCDKEGCDKRNCEN